LIGFEPSNKPLPVTGAARLPSGEQTFNRFLKRQQVCRPPNRSINAGLILREFPAVHHNRSGLGSQFQNVSQLYTRHSGHSIVGDDKIMKRRIEPG
jgi:hypothetical protein